MNVGCHYCRISSNKKSKDDYLGCSSCSHTFCTRCITDSRYMNTTRKVVQHRDWKCGRCLNQCCCSVDICTIDHIHCYTYRRTLERHKSVGGKSKMKWTKKKGERVEEESTVFNTTSNKRKREFLSPSRVDENSSCSESISSRYPLRKRRRIIIFSDNKDPSLLKEEIVIDSWTPIRLHRMSELWTYRYYTTKNAARFISPDEIIH